MKLLDKLKNAFFEEVEEEVDETIEIPKTYAKKIDVPKKKINIMRKDDDDVEEEKKIEEKTKEKPVVETRVENNFFPKYRG